MNGPGRRVSLELVPWESADAEALRAIPFDSPAEHWDAMQAQLITGGAQCFRVWLEGHPGPAGQLVTRVEEEANGRELVVIAAYLNAPGGLPLTDQVSTLIDDLARAESCISIRFHTGRPAAARYMAERHGYRLAETIMRKAVV